MKQTPLETTKQNNTLPIPAIGIPRPFSPPEARSAKLNFGSNMWVLENNALPVIVLQLALPGGSGFDGENWGQANLVSEMLTESVGEYDALEFSDLLYENAIDVSISTGIYETFILFSFHKDQLDTVLPLLKQMLFTPQFTEKDWDRVKTNQINSILQTLEDAPSIAAQYDGYFLYGTNHPIGIPSEGTPKTVKNLSKEAAKSWHQERLIPTQAQFSIVGDISAEEIKEKLELLFENWSSDKTLEPTISADIITNKGILLLDMPGAEQTTIQLFSPAFEKNAHDEHAADLAGIVMGGSFTSRLNAILRTEKGYTYGIGSRFVEERYQNYFITSTNVQTSVTLEALEEMFRILNSAKEGFSEEEFQKAKSSSRSSIIELSTERKRIASQNIYAMLNGETPDFLSKDLEKYAAVTLEQMKAAAKYFDPSNGIVLLVGDSSAYEEKLKAAGFEYQKVELPE